MNTITLLNEKGIEFLAQNNVDINYIPSKNVYILNYRQVETNKNSPYRKYHPVIKECRNLIVRKCVDGTYIQMSRSFTRFFNWTECKEDMDIFTTAMPLGKVTAYEKLDGSLISVTYFDDRWHIFY
jgi:hypothetical protein